MTTATTVTPEQLADGFVSVLREWLSPGELLEVRVRNSMHRDANVCHSHDFCDANEAMYEALVHNGVIERTEDHMGMVNPELDDLWNQAWTVAKAQFLSASAAEIVEAAGSVLRCGECAGVCPDEGTAGFVCVADHRGHQHCDEFVFCSQGCRDTYHNRWEAKA